jgi:hypothetical protein
MLRSGTITNTGTQNLNRLRKISFGKLRRARFRLSSRSQISGSRFMTMGFWSRGPQYRLIISDYGVSSETGPYTDFIVLTH